MNADALRTLVAVGESGSINRASHRLRVSQPTVTRRIQRLERGLGVVLLDRRTKPLALTSGGRRVLERARDALAALDALRTAGADDDAVPPEFRLGVAHSLADVALAAPAEELCRAHPRMALRIVTGWSRGLLEQLAAGALDAAVVQLAAGARLPAPLAGELLASEPLVLVAPRRLRLPRVLTLADAARQSWVLNPGGCGGRTALEQALARGGAPLRVAVETYGLELQLSLVARGVGLGLLPRRVLTRSRLRSRVMTVRLRGHAFGAAVWLAHGRLAPALAPVVRLIAASVARPRRTRAVTPVSPTIGVS